MIAATSIDNSVLIALTQKILVGYGADKSEAAVVAEALAWCDLMGRPNQGLWRLPALVQRLACGDIKSPCRPRFLKSAPATGILEGHHGFGHFLSHQAMREALRMARQCGVGIVGVRNSNHFGAAGYYVELAAQAGMIGVAMSNSFPKVAAFGGRKSVLGTNPLAFGAPRRNGLNVLVDMSTSAAPGSLFLKMIENSDGRPLPDGLAIDDRGRPARDALQAKSLLPFGGAKGYALALMIEILSGVLTGAGFSYGVKSLYQKAGNNGHFFLALDIGRFMPLESYYERLETLVEYLVSSGSTTAAVQLPGENRWRMRDQNLRKGIPLDEPTARSLKEMAGKIGLEVPW